MTHTIGQTFTRTLVAVGLSVGVLGAGIPSQALAQNSNVIVDLSVLSDGGYGSTPSTTRSGELMMPGVTVPKSSYFGPTVTVTNPLPVASSQTSSSMGVASESALSVADSVPPPAPEPAPEPEAVVETAMSTPEQQEMTESPEVPEPAVLEAETSDAMATVSSTEMAAETPPPPPEETAEPTETAASEMVAEESTAETQTAMATSGSLDAVSGQATQIGFGDKDVKLPEIAKSDLDAIAATISTDENLRVQLNAFAGGEDLSSSKARRMSLSRALSVRSYLIEQGVRSTRIDVRARGNDADAGQPINRVDVDITER